MTWTNGKPFVVTVEHLTLNWGGKGTKAFRCGFCGHKFEAGDVARWVYTNNTDAWGNPFICSCCDDPNNPHEAVEKWRSKHKAFKAIIDSSEYWWFRRHYIDIPKENASRGM